MKNKFKNQVIMIGDPKEEERPIELTHCFIFNRGWTLSNGSFLMEKCEQIVYLGHDKMDGDMFAIYTNDGAIEICKGFLNSGKY